MKEISRPDGPVIVIGAAGMDIVGRPSDTLAVGTSNPGRLRASPGGVARNVAENLARLGLEPVLIAAVGDDPQGDQILEQASSAGVNVDSTIRIAGAPTGAYLAVLDHRGALHLGLDDMATTAAISAEHIRASGDIFDEASVAMVDANLSPETLAEVVAQCRRAAVPLVADTTSRTLSERLRPHLKDLWLITPNEPEAAVLCPYPVPHADYEQALRASRHLISQGVDIAILTMAEFGVTYATPEQSGHIPALRTEIVDPTGAGDALTAAVIFALLNDIPLDEAARLGVSAAALTLRTQGSVRPDLSLELLYDQFR